jgi:methylated-DNA-[protein]-cysteine S-methyltransferase
MSKYHFSYNTKYGDIVIIYNENGVSDVRLPYDGLDNLDGSVYRVDEEIKQYFDDYFEGKEPKKLKLDLKVTPFQKKVFEALLNTKRGDILTYGDIGNIIGCSSPRAIGQALKRNPIPLIIACHRVVGKGWDGGFGGETLGEKMELKKYLIEIEKSVVE